MIDSKQRGNRTDRIDRTDRAASPQHPFFIVGVGASAGGLDAFKLLLQSLPTDTGAAFVLVQHLDPKHASALPEILSRATAMPVTEARAGVGIEPDHVYVIPPSMDVEILDGHLGLVPRTVAPAVHLPVDVLFRTLAGIQGSKAIGVILSGRGSDGTLGLQAIRAAGGICFAQDPQSARYDSMPRSAVAAGCVDAVLTPGEIAGEIARLAGGALRRPVEAAADESLSEDEEDGFEKTFLLLKEATGSDLGCYKKPTLLRRIRRRMGLAGIQRIQDYVKHLAGHPDEVQGLYQDLLIGVTSFFRDPSTVEALMQSVFPQLITNRSPEEPLRLWVPGCSTGEEVYTLAICLLELLDSTSTNPSIQIFGTDVSESAVAKARTGIYPESIAGHVTPERLERFFTRSSGHYQISKAVRSCCLFARHDLLQDPPFSRLDLISCRNVLIYLKTAAQKRVMAGFHYALKPTGFLVLGSSESPASSLDLFRPVDGNHKIYAPAAASPRSAFGFGSGASSHQQSRPGERSAAVPESGSRTDLLREADRVLLTRYGPVGVLIDESLEILQFRGNTSPYLEHAHGEASLSLTRMARKGLLAGLSLAVQEAKATGKAVRRPGLTSQRGQRRFRGVEVEAIPVPGPEGQRCFLVLFEEPAAKPAAGRRLDDRDSQIARLDEELATTRHYLQSVIEDQGAANEDLQAGHEEALSRNEELQSLNEELETAKEELQSGNEELTTLNEELDQRNLELVHLSDDLVNLLGSLHVPVILLGPDLRLRRFTPGAAKLFNLLPADRNRLLSDLRSTFDVPDLGKLILEAIETVTTVEREVQDARGCWYSLRIHPYETSDHKIDGAVMILVGIDNLKRSAAIQQGLVQEAERASQLKEEFVATVSHELRGPLSAMTGWMYVLEANRGNPEILARGLAALDRNIKAQAKLVDDLLDTSRVMAGKLHLSVSRIELLPVVEAALQAVSSAAEAKGIRLELSSDGAVTEVLGDADRMQQVAWNLLSNAVKFTPVGGRVEVRLGRAGNCVRLQVRDTGKGISPEFQPHVFERFRQEESSLMREQLGLGLGLAIVRDLVELQGGTVEVESSGKDQGSTFTASFPVPALLVEPPTRESDPAETRAASRPMLAGLRLLVVEDDDSSREMLVTLLEQHGAQVAAAASAGEALTALESAVPDVLISDIGMPGESGYDLMRKVRSLSPEDGGRVPAIAFTAYSSEKDRLDVLAAGFQVHHTKPTDPSRLFAAITALALQAKISFC